MPIYEYKCKECKHEFEEILSIDSRNPECPKCKSETERLMSHFCGIVKGSENRSIDSLVGADADRRREILRRRKENNTKVKIIKKGGI
jgi:putative FmdB family regulatory protein